VGTSSHTDSVPLYLTDLLHGRSFAQVCCAKVSSSEFVILRRFHPHIAKSNSLSGHFFPYGQRSPVSYRARSYRRPGGGAATGAPTADCRRLCADRCRPGADRRRPPPTFWVGAHRTCLAPTCAEWSPNAPKCMRRNAAESSAEHSPNRRQNRRIGALASSRRLPAGVM
jgi:hypothetical protein